MMAMKVTKDGFVWLTIDSATEALAIWDCNTISMYRLYDDDSEGMIESKEEALEAIEKGIQIGIEVGGLGNEWVRKDNAIEAHRKACQMINCVDCLFGECREDCGYQKEFINELDK